MSEQACKCGRLRDIHILLTQDECGYEPAAPEAEPPAVPPAQEPPGLKSAPRVCKKCGGSLYDAVFGGTCKCPKPSPQPASAEHEGYWKWVINGPYQGAVLRGGEIRHLHSSVVKEVFAQVQGTKTADVMAGLMFALDITEERSRLAFEELNRTESQLATLRESQQECVEALKAADKWMRENYRVHLPAVTDVLANAAKLEGK